MSNFYNKFQRRETLACDIQNYHLANRPIRLLDNNTRYTKHKMYAWIGEWRYISTCEFVLFVSSERWICFESLNKRSLPGFAHSVAGVYIFSNTRKTNNDNTRDNNWYP